MEKLKTQGTTVPALLTIFAPQWNWVQVGETTILPQGDKPCWTELLIAEEEDLDRGEV